MRYFIEVAYMGNNYAGFQIQKNAHTVQAEVESALGIYYHHAHSLTGSSRTDAGVHAKQNFFHFDTDISIQIQKDIYHLNAILPADIVIKNMIPVSADAHCRFDALHRTYRYSIYQYKNPFLANNSFYVPYPLNAELLNAAANTLMGTKSFKSFSKKNTQVHTHICTITASYWQVHPHEIVYTVRGNRFLRGMVRGMVGTMLLVAKGKYSIQQFCEIIASDDASQTDFSVPAKGLTLQAVAFNIPQLSGS